MVQMLLLTGNAIEAQALVNEYQDHGEVLEEFSELAQETRRQLARVQAVLSGDLSLVLTCLPQAEAKLWCYSAPTLGWTEKLMRLGSVRRGTAKTADTSASSPVELVEFVGLLGAAYSSRDSVLLRLIRVAPAVAKINRLPTLVQRILALAAIYRYLRRLKQTRLAVTLKQEIVTFFESIEVRGHDPFGIFDDEDVKGRKDTQLNAANTMQTAMRRSVGHGGLALRIAGILGWARLRGLISASKRTKRMSEEEVTAVFGVICDHFAQFRGPVLKFGQMLATYNLPLPDMVNRRLEDLTVHARVMPKTEIESTLSREYGRALAELFSDFEFDPIGIGSVGQVHRARLKNVGKLSGRDVAVKVLFPGIDHAISYDLFLIRSIAPIVKFVRPNIDFGAIVEELSSQFSAELNLLSEASHQLRISEIWQDDQRIKIPETYLSLCRPSVMVSEFCRGKTFNEFCETASQTDRDAAGQAIVNFVVSSCRDGYFNSDPNAGNFLFDGSRVQCIDFGSMKVWDERFTKLWKDLIIAGITKNRELYRLTICAMGIVSDEKQFDFDEAFQSMIETGSMGYIANDGAVSIPINLIQDDLLKTFGKRSKNARLRRFPSEFMMGFRVYFGHMALVARMGSVGNWNQIVRKVMNLPAH